MNYVIREIKESEHELLNEFLYEAIFIPEGTAPPPKSIIENRDLQVYVKDFGLFPDDKCYVAEVDNKVIGAVWVRIMNDYGHVDDETPSFAISIYKEYRNFGIGTELMKTMLDFLKERGYKQASLAVQKANYAVKMYLNVGFEIINENDEEFIMTCSLNSDLSV
ncbi:MAG: GNAT family N-acetyltransferase [Ruminococcus sp.]|nr:GNAT family N-acetyltransferase [Ruminococcus sp.]